MVDWPSSERWLGPPSLPLLIVGRHRMGGHLNVIGIRSSLHAALARRGVDAASVDPWYFPTPEAYSALLQQAGLRPTTAYLYPRPTPLPRESGLIGWLQVRRAWDPSPPNPGSHFLTCPPAPWQTFAGPFVNALPEGARRQMLDEVEEQAKVDMYDQDNDQWTVMCESRLLCHAHFPSQPPNSPQTSGLERRQSRRSACNRIASRIEWVSYERCLVGRMRLPRSSLEVVGNMHGVGE